MKNYLITGIAGTGKSAVARELHKASYRILETDNVEGNRTIYRRRYDKRSGELSKFQRGDGWQELMHVMWHIDASELAKDLVGPDNDVQFVCGYANNWNEMKSHFDAIFLLVADAATIEDRLLNRKTGDWGRKHPEELKHALETARQYNEEMMKIGAIPIDAHQPLDSITKQIISRIS